MGGHTSMARPDDKEKLSAIISAYDTTKHTVIEILIILANLEAAKGTNASIATRIDTLLSDYESGVLTISDVAIELSRVYHEELS